MQSENFSWMCHFLASISDTDSITVPTCLALHGYCLNISKIKFQSARKFCEILSASWNYILIKILIQFVIKGQTDNKWTLVQIMAWCHQASSHYWNHVTATNRYVNHCDGNQPLSASKVNTLRPRQNGRHFADDIFRCIFLNENFYILIKISMKFVPKGPIDNSPALV